MMGMQKFKVLLPVVGGLVALLALAQVGAQENTLAISDAQIDPGASGSVQLEALGIADPGLGAWSVDIVYDADVLAVEGCAPENGSVCNAAFAENTVRVTGATASGLEGDAVLASIDFMCDIEGSSDLTLAVLVFADATPGDPQPIEAEISNGSVLCQEGEEEPTDTPAPATEEPGPTDQPTTQPTAQPTAAPGIAKFGTGPGGVATDPWTLAVVGLIGAGAAWLIVAVGATGLRALPARASRDRSVQDPTPNWLRMRRRD